MCMFSSLYLISVQENRIGIETLFGGDIGSGPSLFLWKTWCLCLPPFPIAIQKTGQADKQTTPHWHWNREQAGAQPFPLPRAGGVTCCPTCHLPTHPEQVGPCCLPETLGEESPPYPNLTPRDRMCGVVETGQASPFLPVIS